MMVDLNKMFPYPLLEFLVVVVELLVEVLAVESKPQLDWFCVAGSIMEYLKSLLTGRKFLSWNLKKGKKIKKKLTNVTSGLVFDEWPLDDKALRRKLISFRTIGDLKTGAGKLATGIETSGGSGIPLIPKLILLSESSKFPKSGPLYWNSNFFRTYSSRYCVSLNGSSGFLFFLWKNNKKL